jgi:hypothetical protein
LTNEEPGDEAFNRMKDYEEARGTLLKGNVLEKLGMCYERDVDIFGIHAVLYALARDALRAAAGDHRRW